MRELVDDDALMLDLARVWLPRYVGPSLTLFRGENINRYEAGRIGSAWSDLEETANTFAGGLMRSAAAGSFEDGRAVGCDYRRAI